ncbi:MAG TPA: MmcQ/YjbR family DNA-binding protein [Phenylobacterium sp.]
MATWGDFRAAGLALPGVREAPHMGEPKLAVGRKGIAHLWGKRVLMKLEAGHQELLFEARPDVFRPFTAGAMRWSWVDMEALDVDEVPGLVLEAWTCVVPRKTSRAFREAS